MSDENPYQSPRGEPLTTCSACGGHRVVRTDKRVPRFGVIAWILFGWLVLIFRYAFVMPVDTCQDCGVKVHVKPIGSLILMILLICILPVLPQALIEWFHQCMAAFGYD